MVLAILAYFMVVPRRRYQRPPSTDNDDEGGEPLDDGLPDLDLPPASRAPSMTGNPTTIVGLLPRVVLLRRSSRSGS
ncbi:hypothetical protein [Hymenobacter qilianensis]|uniref:hypothetical protein n=1 Tax=Hymenobacter qilianensis TaxID=1385715 RepID=UPI001CB92D92|nr:hypothetical protein [Hymenobacter qilianensis]